MNSKYPRTYHVPWSKGATNDDKIASSIINLIGQPIVITEKIDGSNACLEYNGCFARTHASAPTHPSFDGLKVLHANVKYKLLENMQFFGEWVYAKHSIAYDALPGYFMLFNIRDFAFTDVLWAPWRDIEIWAEELSIPTVPVLFKGTVGSEKELKELTKSFMIEPSLCGGIREGVVIRIQKPFMDYEFDSSVMKCVRANHVQTSEHWKNQQIIKNKLKV